MEDKENKLKSKKCNSCGEEYIVMHLCVAPISEEIKKYRAVVSFGQWFAPIERWVEGQLKNDGAEKW